MQQREVFPEELVVLFEETVQHEFPFAGHVGSGPEGTDYDAYWSYRVAQGVGILKCSLRDAYGNEEDFEWELIHKTL